MKIKMVIDPDTLDDIVYRSLKRAVKAQKWLGETSTPGSALHTECTDNIEFLKKARDFYSPARN